MTQRSFVSQHILTFISRVKALYPEEIDNEELNALMTTIRNQGDEIEMKDKEIVRLKTKIEKMQASEEKLKAKLEKAKPAAKTTAAKAPATKKRCVKKTTEE